MEHFDVLLSDVIDSTLGLRYKSCDYQYDKITRSLIGVYFCGGSCVEVMPNITVNHTSSIAPDIY